MADNQDVQEQGVLITLATETRGEPAKPFQDVAAAARDTDKAVDEAKESIESFSTQGGDKLESFSRRGTAGLHSMHRTVNQLSRGFGGLGFALSGAEHHSHEAVQGMHTLHSAMMLAHVMTGFLTAAQQRQSLAAQDAALRQKMQATAHLDSAIAAGRVASAEAILAAAKERTTQATARAVAAGTQDLEITRQLTVAKGQQAAAEKSLAAAKGMAGGGGAVGQAAGAAGGGMAGMLGKIIPGAMLAFAGASIVQGIFGNFQQAAKEKKEEEEYERQNDYITRKRDAGLDRLGSLNPHAEARLAESYRLRQPFRQKTQHYKDEALGALAKAKGLREHPDQFIVPLSERLHPHLEAMNDALGGRVHGQSDAERDKAMAAGMKGMSDLFAHPEANMPASLKRRSLEAAKMLNYAENRQSKAHSVVWRQRKTQELAGEAKALRLEEENVEYGERLKSRKATYSAGDGATRVRYTPNEKATLATHEARKRSLERAQDALKKKQAAIGGPGLRKGGHVGLAPQIQAMQELVQATEAVKRAQQEVTKAKQAELKYSTDQLKTFRDQAAAQEKHFAQARRAAEDRLQGAQEHIGGMTGVDRQATLTLAKKLKGGEQLTFEEERFAKSNSVLKQMMESYYKKQFQSDPIGKQIVALTGHEKDVERAKAGEKAAHALTVKVEQQLNVRLRANAKSMANQLEKELIPMLRTMIEMTAKQLSLALTKNVAKQIEEEAKKAAQRAKNKG